MFWWTCLPEHHSQHPEHLTRANRARFKAAQIAFMCSTLITTVLKTLWRLTATYPHMYLTREGFGPSDIESWLPYFCHKLAPYGCNRTIKGWERTKDLYSPFDRSPTVWKKYIFCFFTYTHKQKKHVRTHTHMQWRPRPIDSPRSLSSMLTMLEWTGSWLPGSQKRVP